MASIVLVETAREGFLWEVLAYDLNGKEEMARFDTEQEAVDFANKVEGNL